MRILLVPEVYRPDDLTACGTVNDAVRWVEEWLAIDDGLHVYWLLPPPERAGYDPAYVHADHDRVTLVAAEPFAADRPSAALFTDGGYSTEELVAVREAVYDRGAYLDAVVDQRRTGRFTLYKWLLEHTDHWAATVDPLDVVANVHDLQVPEKYRYCSHRNDFQQWMAICGAAFADGIWFSAGVDEERFREYATDALAEDVVDRALERAVTVGSPIDFDAHEPAFAADPQWLHVAGSFWEKKNADVVMALANRLHEQFDIRTVLTSMDAIPAEYRAPEWVEAHSRADRATYERALRTGDLAICASDYETVARTHFEQLASGQVLLLRDEPWIYDCIPADYPLVADLDRLASLAVRAVEDWASAVDAARDLLEHVRSVRSPEAIGRRTYANLAGRVLAKRRQYDPGPDRSALREALATLDERFSLDEVVAATADVTDGEAPLTANESIARIDVVYELRSMGYADSGDPGTPTFERVAPERTTAGSTPD